MKQNNRRKIRGYLELLLFLTLRQIKVRYKQTVLGFGWAVLKPFMMMVVFSIVFSKFAGIGSDGVPYPIFSYSALLPWTFFSASLTTAVSSMVSHCNLIKQIYFPREIFPLSAILAGLFDFFLASILFAGMLVFYRIPITPVMVYVIPLLLMMIAFTLAAALFLSAFNVFYRDVEHAVAFVVQLLMFATPVVYSVSAVPAKYRFIYMLNPLAVIIDGFRRVVVQGEAPNIFYLAISVLLIGGLFALSYFYFKRMEMKFADII